MSTEKPRQSYCKENVDISLDANAGLSDPEGKLWSLEELSSLSQVEMERRRIPTPGGRVSQVPTARTIRYYTSLGLVDRPMAYDGGLAQYGPRHLLQLLAIKVLQAEYLPLPEIQKQLYGRSEDELRQLIVAATRNEAVDSKATRPKVESWLSRQLGPGIQLVVTERQAFHNWLRHESPEEVLRIFSEAIGDLSGPK